MTDIPSSDAPDAGTADHLPEIDTSGFTAFDTLIVGRRGRVGWLVNNRPDQLNAMSSHMRDELGDAWNELEADPEVRVIVHTGEGRAFQTGVDVAEIASDGVGMERYRRSMEDFDIHFTAWHQGVTKPVITAVNGICAGGGFHWIADADICIAAADSQFFDPHVSIGQVVSLEAIGLIRKMPVEAVMRMALVGRYERMSADRAYELGMISEIVDPPGALRARAQELAETIARNSPAAMAATKRALWGALEHGLTDACKAGAADLVSMWGHPDQTEGPTAFAEKREPVWQPPVARNPGETSTDRGADHGETGA
jgi:enoyl-CoA hydratase/carnithine racemase